MKWFGNICLIGVVAHENSGNPILLWRVGLTDLRGLYESIFPEDDLKALVQILETYYILKSDSDSRFIQIKAIFDMKEFGLRHVTVNSAMKILTELCKTYEAHYPEVLRKLFIINTPKIFEMVFALVKPLLNERTISKIHIYGNDSAIWKEALVASIPADCLPVSYGGTKTDPIDGNPDCSSLVSMGGEIPKSCYLVNNQTNLIDSNTEGFLLVKNRTKQFLAIKIGNPNTLFKWEFHSEDGDIEFSVTGKRGQYEEIVVPAARVDCHISKIRGQMFCDDYKLFILEFDNSFSYIRSKKIWYKINLELLQDESSGQFSCETYATI